MVEKESSWVDFNSTESDLRLTEFFEEDFAPLYLSSAISVELMYTFIYGDVADWEDAFFDTEYFISSIDFFNIYDYDTLMGLYDGDALSHYFNDWDVPDVLVPDIIPFSNDLTAEDGELEEALDLWGPILDTGPENFCADDS